MNRIRNKQTISGDWVLAGGKIERVIRNALSELGSSVVIDLLTVKKPSGAIMLGEEAKSSNIVEYTATVNDKRIRGVGECYMLMYPHPDLKVLYSTYIRIYWSST